MLPASTTLVASLVPAIVLTPVVRLFIRIEVASPVPLGEVSRMTAVTMAWLPAISSAVLTVVVPGFRTVVRPGAVSAVELALCPTSVLMRAVRMSARLNMARSVTRPGVLIVRLHRRRHAKE